MALSNVLQFDCSMDNQIARNATKNFAEMLGKAFEQYKIKFCTIFTQQTFIFAELWNEYLKLLKHYEGVDFKIPLELFESDIFDNKDIIAPAIDQVLKNTEASSHKNISCSFDSISSIDNISPNTSINHQIQEDKLLKSPILIKKYPKSKKESVTNGRFNVKNYKKNEMRSRLPTKLDTSILINLENNVKQETLSENENKCSIIENKNDEIDTSVTKMSKKLGVSTLYNVDTTLLQNGKKLRQSKLVVLEDEQSTNTIDQKYNSSNFLTVHVPPKFKKDIEENFKNHNNSIAEDIIQNSPSKRRKLNLKMKNVKLKYITSEKGIKQTSPSCHSPSLQTSIKENQTCLFTKPKVFNFCSGNVSNDDKIQENNGRMKEKTYSKATGQLLGINSSCDETFCMLGEEFKQKSACDTNELKENKSSRKNLMNSFDIPDKEEHIFVKPSKKKLERAQMNGVSCWECKRYYASLGLSEEEIKMRQNKCSRHRTVYNERNSTPDDFWNPLFPDASFNSTYQD
ncbi:hypothetical protein E2986_11260 [Frieseomelitta varia]|uniref:DNA endonuclease RBBP8 n=1 Tax=Frieseomelitta varia TaxID=561572 RepID=A0A833S1H9_9HYME|nr:hypothetical protein E2986_11260 [Frieseomelitta varia]